MSGHSKWHSIRHKKAATDAKRGKLFSKIIKEITVAARIGGGDATGNPRLRTVLEKAKGVNMPAENIKRAIQKGTGELPGMTIDEISYEGYGPGGFAVMVEALTDNKNRTVSEIRHIFAKGGGNLGETNSVAWMFEKRGFIAVAHDKYSEEQLMELILEAGADDLQEGEEFWEIYTAPDQLHEVRAKLEENQVEIENAELSMIPQNEVKLEGKQAQAAIRLMEALEDQEDTQQVWCNFDIAPGEFKE